MRLFAGVWATDEVVTRLRALPRPDVPAVRWTTESQWHVTLAFLGEVPAEERDVVTAALEAAAARVAAPPQAVLGPAVVVLGRSVLCVPVAGLDELATAVRAELVASGVMAADPVPFHGHLTVARARGNCRMPRQLAGAAFGGRFAARQVCLVASLLDPGGAVYTTVGEAVVGGAGEVGTSPGYPTPNVRSPLES